MNIGLISDDLKTSMRRNFFSILKSQQSLETYELDLFEWFRKETEGTLEMMDTDERAYIQQQLVEGVDDVNDSGTQAVDYYRKRMRHSHVIFLASLLEGAMKRECDRLAKALALSLIHI